MVKKKEKKIVTNILSFVLDCPNTESKSCYISFNPPVTSSTTSTGPAQVNNLMVNNNSLLAEN